MSLNVTEYRNNLNNQHFRSLVGGSAIAPDLLAGVRTIEHGRDLPPGFSRRQRRRGRGMLFEGTTLAGDVFAVYRPDNPDPDRPGLKYECQPKRRPGRKHGGPGNFLFVHESQRHLIPDTSFPVVYVEGLKKALSLLTAIRAAGVEVLIVGILGTWNWMSDGKPIPDMFEIPVEGREVGIDFDSDLLRNPGVQGACKALAGHLIGRGASVGISYLNDRPDGSKMGDDDFFADGHTWAELQALKRPYDPADFAVVRSSRDEDFAARVADLWRRWREMPASTPGECSARDTFLVYVQAAASCGEVVPDGLRVRLSQGTTALRAKVSRRTLWKSHKRLEDMGFGYRDNEGRKPDQAGAFVLRARVSQGEGERPREGTGDHVLRSARQPDLHPRAPRLMWSTPGSKPRRGLVSGTRKIRQGPPPEPRPAIKRLGKIRGAVLDVLDAAGGSATLQEIADALQLKRARDLVRRKTTDKGRDGLLVWLIEDGIISVDGDLVTLTADWSARLDATRYHAGEIEAEERNRDELATRRKAYHARRKPAPASTPSAAGLAAVERSHRRREKERMAAARPVSEIAPAPAPDPEIVAALAAALRRWPDHRDDYPSWWASTLYFEDYLPTKPTPAAVEVALAELTGVAA